ncbi:MAG: T9SS type A sorting domain-containing protein [Saprospiraceae bacterium]|nr:T9SS type A sorting domain-containing protein [Saprospiraceae bacterium]
MISHPIKHKLRQLLLTICGVLSLSVLAGQALVDATKIAEISRDSLVKIFSVQPENGIHAYKVLYLTTGADGQPDTASGLVTFPDVVSDRGLLAYQHGTTDGPEDVPSRLNAEALLSYAYAGFGYIVTAADYIGMGDSRGLHPYLHAETEASAGIDLLLAARTLAGQLEFSLPDQIFVSGYSQGGHAAMAMARAIQERPTDDLWLTAAAPMSGPYDISGTMRDLVLFSDRSYLFPSYIVYFILGYQEVYGDIFENLEQIFKAPYVQMIDRFRTGAIGLSELNDQLKAAMLLNERSLIPRRMLNEAYLMPVLTDSLHPLNLALRDNDTYRWSPEMPMRLYYCMADEQVAFENSLIAEAYMRDAGAADVQALDLVSSADHGECVLPAVLSSIAFFNSFPITTSSETASNAELHIYPNPATDVISFGTEASAIRSLTIFNTYGQIIENFINLNASEINIAHLPNGQYFLRGTSKEGPFTGRFLVVE